MERVSSQYIKDYVDILHQDGYPTPCSQPSLGLRRTGYKTAMVEQLIVAQAAVYQEHLLLVWGRFDLPVPAKQELFVNESGC